MKRWRFVLEAVTPVYLGGEDPTKAEWRPTTLKNLMRWWYRAGKAGRSPVEGNLFGTTDNSSRFKLNIRPLNGTPKVMNLSQGSGIHYLGYSLTKRKCFPPGSKVEMAISFRWMKEHEQRVILASLWLMLWLGGVGARWRRGFGSLVTKIDSDMPSGLDWNYSSSSEDFQDFLARNLLKAREWLGAVDPGAALPSYSLLSPRHTLFYLWSEQFQPDKDAKGNSKGNAMEKAMNRAGELLRDFRERKYDYEAVRQFLLAGIVPPTIYRAAFGLPLQFYSTTLEKEFVLSLIEKGLVDWLGSPNGETEAGRIAGLLMEPRLSSNDKERIWNELEPRGVTEADFKGLLKEARKLATCVVEGRVSKRRASPLIIKIARLSEDDYRLLFLFPKAELLPGNEQLKLTQPIRGGKRGTVSHPDFRVIDDFFAKYAGNLIPISISI